MYTIPSALLNIKMFFFLIILEKVAISEILEWTLIGR